MSPFKLRFAAAPVTIFIVLVMFLASGASAAELRIGSATEPSAIDPQFSTVGANQQISSHIFDTLTQADEKLQLKPGLALSWTMIDDLTWEVKLRPGVKFHDGSEFNADDVVFSIKRIPNVPESPSTYERNVKDIAEMVVVDPLTIRFKMKKPAPQFPLELSFIFVISNELPENVTTNDFNKNGAAVGTGPFKFVEWVPGDRIVFQRNDDYWGGPAAFEKVVIKPISNDSARVTALLAGDVDMIDGVPPMDLKRLRSDENISLWSTPSSRMIYIHMDTDRDESPMVKARDGRPPQEKSVKGSQGQKSFFQGH